VRTRRREFSGKALFFWTRRVTSRVSRALHLTAAGLPHASQKGGIAITDALSRVRCDMFRSALNQFDTGTVVGTVKDKSGGSVSHAKVTSTNAETGVSVTRTSNSDGNHEFVSMRGRHLPRVSGAARRLDRESRQPSCGGRREGARRSAT